MDTQSAKFAIGQVVRHRVYPFRGVIFDVDPTFSNTEEYWLSIPENIRPHKDQPFYHLLAENDESSYVAYVSEQNLVPDETGQPVGHPQASMLYESIREGHYKLRPRISQKAFGSAAGRRKPVCLRLFVLSADGVAQGVLHLAARLRGGGVPGIVGDSPVVEVPGQQ